MQLLKYLKPYILLIVVLIVFTVGQVAATLEIPDYAAQIINEGILGGDQDMILPTGIKMLAIALIGGFCTIVAGFLAARIGTGFARDLREGLFTKVQAFSLAEINEFSTSSLITRSTNDIQQLQTVIVMILRLVVSAPITAVWAIYKAYQIAPEMTWIMAVAVGLLMTVIVAMFVIVIPKFQLVQKLTDKLNLVSRENLTGIRVIRAFNKQGFERIRLNLVNLDLTNVNLFVTRATSILWPVMFLILNLVSIAVIWFGSHLVEEALLNVGDMLAYIQYASQVIISFLLISMVFVMLPRALVSAKRVLEVLNIDPSILDPEKPKKPKNKTGEVEFNDVTFGYSKADVPVLENISFTAKPSETTAIIGSTGSGKSTLINLIPRFYDTLYGEVLIDGVDIKKMTQEELRSRIGYVPQKAVLFSGTISENIRYGSDDIPDEDVIEAAKIAQASEFIENLPDGYDSPVSQSGTNLSGGQKQRLSIARAIAKDPEIYIYDDTFSALDYQTELKLRKNLEEAGKHKTTLIVAQRVNSIVHADQIIVLDQGEIVCKGTHVELIKNCEVYQDIARSQLSEEELAKYGVKGNNNGSS